MNPLTEVIMQHDHVHTSLLRGRSRAFRFVHAIALCALTMCGVIGACTSDGPAGPCANGFVNAEGICEGKCTPDKCLDHNTCVNNRCVLMCDAHSDCLEDGTQNCLPAIEDDTKSAIMTCQPNGQTSGVGVPCANGDECAQLFSCRTTGERCDPMQCGGAADACTLDAEACYAKANCRIGKCPDGSACTVFSCSPQDCTAELTCVTKGTGDADAYCTKNDCADDADCPGGFYCGVKHESFELCGSSPKKGNNAFCGEAPLGSMCIDPTSLGQGNTMFEGSLCILRKACILRKDCDPCTTDLDCSDLANHCVTMSGESQKRCARECVTAQDCADGYNCSALDENDQSKGRVCKHKFGACVGTGKFCEPCVNDLDCGPVTGTSACYEYNGGQRGCFTPCETNADCPPSPSGNAGVCYLDKPDSLFYKHCVPEGNNRCW